MVFGNRDNLGDRGGFTATRPPVHREYGDFCQRPGEDVVAGIRNTEPLAALKDQFRPSTPSCCHLRRLESHYRDMCDTEFTIEQGKLWMLQTRVGKRTGRPP